MFTAQKEKNRLQPVLSTQLLGGFGKVLNSIQGLQQRLGDFSVDEISKANDNVATLIVRLSEVQHRLDGLVTIRNFIYTARTAVKGTATEGPDLNKLLAVDKLQIQAVVNARNLIQFPRLHRAAREAAKSASLNVVDKELDIGTAASAPPPISSNEPEPKGSVTRLPIRPIAEEISTASVPQAISKDEATSQAPVPDTHSTHGDQQTPLREANPPTTAEDSVITSGLATEDAATEPRSQHIESPNDPAADPLGLIAAKQALENNKALFPEDPNFDHKLLDELIVNYGEFAKTPNLPVAVEPVEEPKAKFNNLKSTPGRDNETTRNRVPSFKKDGDLDRKLKKLIKDYGEYDLYPRQSTINLKRGVIAAFLLLAVLFSGFYFFSSPKPVNAPQGSTAADSGMNPNSEAIEAPWQHDKRDKKASPGRGSGSAPSSQINEASELGRQNP